MTRCAYCEHHAMTTIASNPERVCLERAVEFRTGLIAYARDCRRAGEQEDVMPSCPRAVETAPRRPWLQIHEPFAIPVVAS
jgi:hypothetical protein